MTEAVLSSALDLTFADFEDAVIHEAARASRCTGIVTRNAQEFKRADLPVYSPNELLAVLQTRE